MPVMRSFTPAVDQIALAAGTYTGDQTGSKVFVHGAVGILAADQPLTCFRIHIPVTAIAIDGNDELYRFVYKVSNSPTLASGIYRVAELAIGAKEVLDGDTDLTTGEYILHACNEINGVIYSHGRLDLITAGATKSITVGDVFLD